MTFSHDTETNIIMDAHYETKKRPKTGKFYTQKKFRQDNNLQCLDDVIKMVNKRLGLQCGYQYKIVDARTIISDIGTEFYLIELEIWYGKINPLRSLLNKSHTFLSGETQYEWIFRPV